MESSKQTRPPSLGKIAWVFLAIAMQSWGGGMSAWMRREIVLRNHWLTEQQFIGGLALAQITPGPNGVNLAVFIGTTLRGPRGALAALAGMLLAPAAVIMLMGGAFIGVRNVPGVESAVAGLGAAAIGLSAANGLRLTGSNLRRPGAAAVMVTTAVAVGVVGLPLLPVMLVMVPVGLLVAGRR